LKTNLSFLNVVKRRSHILPFLIIERTERVVIPFYLPKKIQYNLDNVIFKDNFVLWAEGLFSTRTILLDFTRSKTMKDYKDIKTFDELIEREHGKPGTESRSKYEAGAKMFIVSEMLKAARKEANLTQEQLAEKAGTKKSYISKLENGKGNIQLSTLIRIFEQGLNRKIGLTFL